MYNLRLADALDDRTEDELESLILWLPVTSAFRALAQAEGDLSRGLELFGWTQEDQVWLELLNLVNHQTYVIAQAASSKKMKAPEPISGPRTPKKTEQTSPTNAGAMARALIAAQKG